MTGLALVGLAGCITDGGSGGGGVDCRNASRACASGFRCAVQSDESWVCVADDGGFGGLGGFGGEGGDSGGGFGGEGGGLDLDMRYVLIDDISWEMAADGTPGVDICGVRAVCDGLYVSPIDVEFGVGEAFICGEDSPHEGIECSTERNLASAALDYGACAGSSIPSDYVSLGGGGRLSLKFGRDLQGCVLEIQEFAGEERRDEAAEVSVCSEGSGYECLTIGGNVVLGTVDEGSNPAQISVPVFW